MKKSLILAALPLILACGSLAAQDTFELHGYMRAGVGRSANGGEQVDFWLPGTDTSVTNGPGYRLGNETDNYIELAMDVRAYEKGNESFILHFRPTFREYYSARDGAEDWGGAPNGSINANSNQMVYIREAYGEARGFLGTSDTFKDASLWAGQRFYQRHDLGIRDQWYWNDSGEGFGIENINVRFGKLHVAYMIEDNGQVQGNGTPNGMGENIWGNPPSGQEVGTLDTRISDMSPWSGAALTVGLEYQHTSASAANQQNPNPGNEQGNMNGGTRLHFLWNQSNFLGGDNTVYLTYANGSAFYGWYNNTTWTHDKMWQAMEMYYIKPAPSFEIQGVFEFRREIQGGVNDASGNFNHQDWFSAGARPTYFFNKHFSVAAELGWDQLKFSDEPVKRFLMKRTLAAQFSPAPSMNSRPVIRLFVTNANWNHEANLWGAVDAGQFSTQNSVSNSFGNPYWGKTDGTTFGAQIEAWW